TFPSSIVHRPSSIVHRPSSIVVLAILLLAFALRVANIEAQGIWGDEAFSIYTAKQSIAYITSGGTDVHPPLYHLLLHCWIPLAGDSPLALRFLSVLWSMVIVASGYALARLMTGDGGRKTGAAAFVFGLPSSVALLLAIAPFQIYYAQETRMYAQAAALCALSLLFFAKWQVQSAKWKVAWLLTTLLAIYTHYFAFFVLAAEDLWFLAQWFRNKSQIKNRKSEIVAWLGVHFLLVLFYLPWVAVQAGDLSSRANTRTSALSPQGVWDVISKSLSALFVGSTLDGTAQAIVALALLLVAVVGWHAYRRSPLVHLLALALALPIVGALIISPLLPYFRERFQLVVSMPFIILLAFGLDAASAMRSRIPHPASRIVHPTSYLLISL
ncbi:MAG: glycosyltransferase family 39 protein, partial [Chloroflexi bacterium]|nr:glycosyltransferase family 39 protein [Chloroflexota bacterium]